MSTKENNDLADASPTFHNDQPGEPISDEKKTLVENNLHVKVLGLCFAVSFILCIVGLPTDILNYDENGTKIDVTFWETEQNINGVTKKIKSHNFECKELGRHLLAGGCFAAVSIVFSVGAIAFCMDKIERGVHEYGSVGVGFFFWLCTLVAWSIQVRVWDHGFCGNKAFKDLDGWKMGPSPFLYIVAFIFQTIGITAFILLKFLNM